MKTHRDFQMEYQDSAGESKVFNWGIQKTFRKEKETTEKLNKAKAEKISKISNTIDQRKKKKKQEGGRRRKEEGRDGVKEKMQINTIYKERKANQRNKQKFNEYYEPLYTNQAENLHKMHRSLESYKM